MKLVMIALAALQMVLTAETVVFRSGDDGYASYRIPAIVRAADGTLLAFAEGRVKGSGDFGDMDLVLKRSADGGATWEPLQVLVDEGNATFNGPVPVVDRETGRVLLVFTRDKREVWMIWSDDNGRTWSAPRNLSPQATRPEWAYYATGPVHGIQLKSGRIIIPCNHLEPERRFRLIPTYAETAVRARGVMRSHVIYSDDHGENWRVGGSLARHTDEAAAAELADGSLYLNMRNYINNPYGASRNYRRAWAASLDGGETWSETRLAPELLTPVCQGSVLTITSGRHAAALLYAGPASTSRRDLAILASPDGGRSWPGKLLVTDRLAAYSDLVEMPEERVGLLYETGDKTPDELIVFTVIPVHSIVGR